jgi:hypothetical protein
MNLQDRLAEYLLAKFDRLMNIFSFGAWSRVCGSHVPNIKVKEK